MVLFFTAFRHILKQTYIAFMKSNVQFGLQTQLVVIENANWFFVLHVRFLVFVHISHLYSITVLRSLFSNGSLVLKLTLNIDTIFVYYYKFRSRFRVALTRIFSTSCSVRRYMLSSVPKSYYWLSLYKPTVESKEKQKQRQHCILC